MNLTESETGAAPTLAIFLIFIIISSGLVLAHLHSMSEREISSIQLLMASDTTRSTISSVNSELNETLYTASTAAMYDVGMKGGSKENVEEYVIKYLNNRIEEGWSYPNLDIDVPLADENSVVFDWQANGSLVVHAYLDTKVEHVKGPTAHGTYLRAAPHPRFLRIKHIAEHIDRTIGENLTFEHLSNLEAELNENYECEGISLDLNLTENHISIDVIDKYGAKVVILGE